MLVQHGKALDHTSTHSTAKFEKLVYELHQPLYLPDLGCATFLILQIKKKLARYNYEWNEGVITSRDAYFADLGKVYFQIG